MSEDEDPKVEKPYSTEQFAFVDESLEDSSEDSGWLSFMNSRAGRKVDRREVRQERTRLIGVTLALVALIGALVLWSPWSSGGEAVDTGHEAMGADRLNVLFQLEAPDGSATLTGVLMHDRRGSGRSAVVTVPADLVLTVEGGTRETVRKALVKAGPTLTREAMGELLGIELAGSWVIDHLAFARLVDSLGGVDVGGGVVDGCPGGASAPGGRGNARTADGDSRGVQIVDGATALRIAACGQSSAVLEGLAIALPGTFAATQATLESIGVLSSPGLSSPALAAVLAGLHRDLQPGGGAFSFGALVLNPSGNTLDAEASRSAVIDVLGGRPGTNPEGTPRILVQLAPGSGIKESDVRADILNAGYEYVDGGAAPAGAAVSVLVRPSMPDAQALGESIATTLGLPLSAVKLSDDVPFTADVVVVMGAAKN